MEIDDPTRFAGRKEQILALAKALHTEGSCPIIYGDRGLGKSSLALQGARIASGDVELLGRHRAMNWEFGEDDEFLAFYVTCTDATSTTPALLQRVINAIGDTAIDETRQMQLMDKTSRKSFKLKLFEAQFERRYEPQEQATYAEKDLEERLVELATRHTSLTGQRVLVVIDELDRVKDTSGLASFLKSYSSDGLKFVLVGIAQNVSNLISDHASIDRIALPVEVPTMQHSELALIIDAAMEHLADQGIERRFSAEAMTYLAGVASGYPWFVHVLGQDALLQADEEGATRVTKEHVFGAIGSLATNRYAQPFADKYQTAVRDSPSREAVLRSFAYWYDRDIPTSQVYRVLRDDLGVRNPSAYKGHLCADNYGRVFLRPPFQDRGVVRFANEMFKVYVRLRHSLYEGLDENVTKAWEKRDGVTEPAYLSEGIN